MRRERQSLAADGVWREVIRLLGDCRGKKVLDAPAGSGMLSRAISGLGAEVYALDILSLGLRGLKGIQSDMNLTLPFRNEKFDNIICVEGIEHMENPAFLLREFSRIMKKKGTLIVTTPNTHNIRSRVKFVLTGFLYWFGDQALQKYGHITPLFCHQLKHFSRNACFEILEITSNRRSLWMRFLSPIFIISGALFNESNNTGELLSGDILILKMTKT